MTRTPRLRPLLGLLTLAGALCGSSGPAAAAPAPTVWGCLPSLAADPCDGSLATTYLSSTTLEPRRVARVEVPVAPADPGIDCFYVYPTVSGALTENAPARLTAEVRAIYRYQAARFSQVCQVFAPIYRQASLAGIVGEVSGGPTDGTPRAPRSVELAYGDVVAAWEDYLQQRDPRRGVVLIGHSQGSGMLIRLLRERIDRRPEERARLVSAIVPGGDLAVAEGQRTGGDLHTIPTCARGDEIGCVIAYSTFSHRPPRKALFGRPFDRLRSVFGLPTRPGLEVACVNPAELSGDGGRLDALTRSESFPGPIGLGLTLMFYGLQPRAATPWVTPGERYVARCQRTGGAHVLIARPADRRTLLPYESPSPDWGLHLGDINLPLGNLIRIVAAQSAAYQAAER